MLTISEAKLHLRVDHGDDDIYIQALVDVAEEYIQRVLTPAGEGAVPPAVNNTQKHAARLLVGHWYENREGVVEGSLSEAPMAVRMLLLVNRPVSGLF